MNDRVRIRFVMPDPTSFVSGGNHYNTELLRALRAAGHDCEIVPPPQARAEPAQGAPGYRVVDTLYLEAVPELVARSGPDRPVLLLAHYLPSLVGRATPGEAPALAAAAGACATSAFMKHELVSRGLPAARVFVAEPGQSAERAAPLVPPEHGLCLLLVANLTEPKGVLPLLEALDAELSSNDRLRLRIVGSVEHDREYAERCRRFVSDRPLLRGRVSFAGALDHELMLQQMRGANAFVSASRMESYGMALAEARVLGLPILARHAGNVGEHVVAAGGGEVTLGDVELARACVRLSRDPAEHRRRLALARDTAPQPRSWRSVAEAFVDGLQALARA